ncbi:hypothetical protein OG21DRAFT_1454290 [Imleria badia]|nr:hypothetical protein OG21DRAFT_1454290 [Imleria badia]
MSTRPPPPRRPPPPPPPTDLSPIRAHYLKKSLVSLQLRSELDDLANAPTLAHLGPPFAPPQPPSPRLDLPLLKYCFRHFVLSFPFMAAAPNDFYSDKLQPFVDSLFARNLSALDDADSQDPAPRRLIAKAERNLSMFITSTIKLDEPEDVLRLSQADLQSLERAVNKRLAKRTPRNSLFHVNIVSVRAVTERGRVRSRVHEEFIIRTTLSHDKQVCVSRRYGDFRTLANELRTAHPDAIVPSPPPKDRTAVEVPVSPTDPQDPSSDYLVRDPSPPGNFYATPSNASQLPSRLSREKNRLTLRAYLHALLATPPFSSSPVLRSFLFSGPTKLSPQEEEDAQLREEADRVREQGRMEFSREIGARVDQLREAVRAFKGDIVGKDGLSHVFAVIKVTPHVRQLPDNHQAVLEWAKISLASTIFQTFMASDNSSDTFTSLKRIHGLMPYFLLKTALKISNPVAMTRTVLDIFLAQPFGGRSLLQRMFTSSLTEEARSLNTYIEHVSAKIDSPVLCEKIRLFVHAPREIQETYRVDARLEHTHLLRAILMASQEPVLSRSLAGRVDRAWKKWAAWMAEREREGKGKIEESDSEEGPVDEEAWLFEDLRVLFRLHSRLRDREQLIALIFEASFSSSRLGVTAELFKDIITIFYTPLAQVYRAASIAESLGDLQNFINDLIRTVEQTEDLSQSDPSATVQAFIDLVNRHEQSFYSFVHKVHSRGQGLFDSLMKWIERFLTAIRDGVGASDLGAKGNKIVLETVLPAGDEERARIMEEVDKVMHWHYLSKIAREEKLRSRFRRTQKGAETNADAEDEATQILINGVASEFDFGDLVRANADELAAEESEDDDDEDSDDYEDDDSEDDTSDHETGSEETGEDMSLQTLAVHSSTIESPLFRAEATQVVVVSTPPETSGLSRSQTAVPSRPGAPRLRSLSLRSTKSMQLPGIRHPSVDAPPVPPLPVHLDKQLPPRPPGSSSAELSRRRSIGHLASQEHGPSGDPHRPPSSPRRHPHKSRKKAATTAQPPELKYIPTLLPIFVEMMRPLLRPQV